MVGITEIMLWRISVLFDYLINKLSLTCPGYPGNQTWCLSNFDPEICMQGLHCFLNREKPVSEDMS
jgi:hypothetical protein